MRDGRKQTKVKRRAILSSNSINLCVLGIFIMLMLSLLTFFFIINFFKENFRNNIRVSNGLDQALFA